LDRLSITNSQAALAQYQSLLTVSSWGTSGNPMGEALEQIHFTSIKTGCNEGKDTAAHIHTKGGKWSQYLARGTQEHLSLLLFGVR